MRPQGRAPRCRPARFRRLRVSRIEPPELTTVRNGFLADIRRFDWSRNDAVGGDGFRKYDARRFERIFNFAPAEMPIDYQSLRDEGDSAFVVGNQLQCPLVDIGHIFVDGPSQLRI